MVPRALGRTGFMLSPIGFGAFKIGRNRGAKYARPYELPTDEEVARLLSGLRDLGVNYIDTAPAYGSSEQRIGDALGDASRDFIISTKVGETFENDRSTFDFSEAAVRRSVERSCARLRRSALDLVFVHSSGDDLAIMAGTDVVPALTALREEGVITAIGFSGKTVEGAAAALEWADAIMVEYHLDDRSHEQVIAEAVCEGVGVVVKKGLASGRLAERSAADAVRFVLNTPGVTSMVIGGLNLDHIRANVEAGKGLPQEHTESTEQENENHV